MCPALNDGACSLTQSDAACTSRYAAFKKAGVAAQEKQKDAGLFLTALEAALEDSGFKDEELMALAPKVTDGKKRKSSDSGISAPKASKLARAAPKDRNAAPVPRERLPLRQGPKPIASNIGAYFAAKHKFNPPLPPGPPPLPKMAPPPELLAAAAKAKAAAAAAAAAADAKVTDGAAAPAASADGATSATAAADESAAAMDADNAATPLPTAAAPTAAVAAADKAFPDWMM